jgi:hypothetical protein
MAITTMATSAISRTVATMPIRFANFLMNFSVPRTANVPRGTLRRLCPIMGGCPNKDRVAHKIKRHRISDPFVSVVGRYFAAIASRAWRIRLSSSAICEAYESFIYVLTPLPVFEQGVAAVSCR